MRHVDDGLLRVGGERASEEDEARPQRDGAARPLSRPIDDAPRRERRERLGCGGFAEREQRRGREARVGGVALAHDGERRVGRRRRHERRRGGAELRRGARRLLVLGHGARGSDARRGAVVVGLLDDAAAGEVDCERRALVRDGGAAGLLVGPGLGGLGGRGPGRGRDAVPVALVVDDGRALRAVAVVLDQARLERDGLVQRRVLDIRVAVPQLLRQSVVAKRAPAPARPRLRTPRHRAGVGVCGDLVLVLAARDDDSVDKAAAEAI
mmetsp:Transcript_20871/g.71802  ORF Transcript_20871/g.71802 Transcript_20871/m.71802 type:complete len:267 (+) Transcript_20871:608-1408(+)